jgi:hypothetical protein
METDPAKVKARLEILYELCGRFPSPRQDDWRTCLWSEARRDRRLRAMGLDAVTRPDDLRTLLAAGHFFGLSFAEAEVIFGSDSKSDKLAHVVRALGRLQLACVRAEQHRLIYKNLRLCEA